MCPYSLRTFKFAMDRIEMPAHFRVYPYLTVYPYLRVCRARSI